MATALTALFWMAVALLALIILLIALPVRLRLRLSAAPTIEAGAEIRLLGGIAPPIRMAVLPRAASARRKSKASETAGPPRRPCIGRARRKRQGAATRMVSAAPGFLAGLIRRIHLDRIAIDGDLGLGDPADTGALFGWLMPLLHAVRSPRFQLDLRPDFSAARLSGRAEAVVSLTPVTLLPPVARFLWHVFGTRR